MTNLELAAATIVGMPAERLPNLPTLSERVEWIIENRLVKSARAWSIEAGKSGGYVGRIKKEPNLNPSLDTIEALARVANVPVDWLRGTAPAPERWVEEEDVYESRGELIELIRGKVDDNVIRALKVERRHKGDPGMAHWKKKLSGLLKDDAEVRELLPDDDTFGEHET